MAWWWVTFQRILILGWKWNANSGPNVIEKYAVYYKMSITEVTQWRVYFVHSCVSTNDLCCLCVFHFFPSLCRSTQIFMSQGKAGLRELITHAQMHHGFLLSVFILSSISTPFLSLHEYLSLFHQLCSLLHHHLSSFAYCSAFCCQLSMFSLLYCLSLLISILWAVCTAVSAV